MQLTPLSTHLAPKKKKIKKGTIFFGHSVLHRVSMKSFPDYKHLLQETLRCTSEEFQHWIIFQKDGAPPHWGSGFRRFFDAAFPNRWIGRDGTTHWPPRSLDITPL